MTSRGHQWVQAGLIRAYGLPTVVGASTSWSIGALSAKPRKSLFFHRQLVITLTYSSEERSYGRTDLHLSLNFSSSSLHSSISCYILFFILHLLNHHPPPMLLSLFLSLYLNITPYLAGVASRHSNWTVQFPWGLWDIVSCWNGTVRMCLWMCCVYVCMCKLAEIFCLLYKSQWLLLDLGCGVTVQETCLSLSLLITNIPNQ